MTREELGKAVDKIVLLPREKRWRPAVDLYLKRNPRGFDLEGNPITAQEEYQAMIRENNTRRNELRTSTGSNKTDSMRVAVSMPGSIMTAIKVLDPDFLEGEHEQKDLRKFMKQFPEFCAPRKI